MPALLKAALALSLLPLVSASADVYAVPDDARIPLVDCLMSRGSAFRVGPHHYLSVTHVTSAPMCAINGKPIEVRGTGHNQDFSYFTVQSDEPGFFRIDCRGFVKGKRYIAIGHARGLERLTAVELEFTGNYDPNSGFALLKGVGTVIPGQSGGPVIDAETKRPVGTVNVYSATQGLSGSRELRETAVCKR